MKSVIDINIKTEQNYQAKIQEVVSTMQNERFE